MTIKPEVLDALVSAGATAEMIVAAIKADLAQAEEKRCIRRENDAARQRRHRANVTNGHAESRVTGCDSPLPDKENPPNPLKKITLTPTPSEPKGSSVPKPKLDFDGFWLAYPRKAGKGAARKAYLRSISKIGGDDPQAVLLSALANARPGWTDPQFIPHPATWLNQERWEDGDGLFSEKQPPPPDLSPEDQAIRAAKWADYLNKLENPEEADA